MCMCMYMYASAGTTYDRIVGICVYVYMYTDIDTYVFICIYMYLLALHLPPKICASCHMISESYRYIYVSAYGRDQTISYWDIQIYPISG